jgi:hypothetical protein
MATMYDDTVTFDLRKAVGKLYEFLEVDCDLDSEEYRGDYSGDITGVHFVIRTKPSYSIIPGEVFTTINLSQGKKNFFEVTIKDTDFFQKVKFRPEDKNDKSRCLTKYEAHILANYEVKKEIEPKESKLEKKTEYHPKRITIVQCDKVIVFSEATPHIVLK